MGYRRWIAFFVGYGHTRSRNGEAIAGCRNERGGNVNFGMSMEFGLR